MEQKMIDFWIEEHELNKMFKMVSKHRFFACCLVKTLQIPVLLAGLLWELEVIQVKKTPVFTIHFKLLVEKPSRKTMFSTHLLKNTVNSGVLDEFCPWCCNNIVDARVFSSKGTKLPNTTFLDVFGQNYLTGSNSSNNNNNNNNKKNNNKNNRNLYPTPLPGDDSAVPTQGWAVSLPHWTKTWSKGDKWRARSYGSVCSLLETAVIGEDRWKCCIFLATVYWHLLPCGK